MIAGAPVRGETPPFFRMLICRRLGGTPRLARALWMAYQDLYPFTATSTAFALNQIFSGLVDNTPDDVIRQRIAHGQHLLPPAHLLAACQRLSPEGPNRRRDVIDLEQQLLDLMDAAGHWK